MPDRITSVQNQRVKNAVRLRDRRGREEQQRMIIDGTREISRALDAGVQITEVFVCEGALDDSERAIAKRAAEHGAAVYDVTSAIQSKLAYGDREGGLVAVASLPPRSLALLSVPSDALVAVLERVEKPGNVGAVARSADAAGVSAVLVADGGTDIFNPNAIRASGGTIFSLPVIPVTAEAALAWLRTAGFHIFATRVGSSERYWDAPLHGRSAIVLGNEAGGLSNLWVGEDIEAISVPQLGIADSLNVSVTAAILFYEALRQRELGRKQARVSFELPPGR